MVVQQERVLTQNVRTAEALCVKSLQVLSHHAMEVQQYHNQMKEVSSLPDQISRANAMVRDIVLLTQKLNALLPSNEQLAQLKLGSAAEPNKSMEASGSSSSNNTNTTTTNNTTTTTTSNLPSVNNTITVNVHNAPPTPPNNNDDNNNPTGNTNNNSKNNSTGVSLKVRSGIASEQGARPTMEDSHVAVDNLYASISTERKPSATPLSSELSALLQRSRFYAVYDGHGGSQTALECGKKLHKYLIKQGEFLAGDCETAIRNAYNKMDKRLLAQSERYRWSDGSTAATLLVIDDTIFVANCGDTEIVMGTKRGSTTGLLVPFVLTQNHKPYDREERTRIEQAGGAVIFGRVMGSLAVSRALGDFSFKAPMNATDKDFVTSDPYVRTVALNKDDELIVLACDGLWDVVSYDRAVSIAEKARKDGKTPEEAAKLLVQTALKNHSQDNVTVVVLYLSW
eukprot:TRINITY_DN3551_c0_g1_i2.p1 TRINITY_DN3551_c0_g1~~TRINITY_DN3551_c0_g1_i2.p1  ORF type:complete len:454 (+),score=115.29 TRINITY_DN3551_c0_g1_i2:623-1984(+)